MKLSPFQFFVLLVSSLALMVATHASADAPVVPNPILYFVTSEPYQSAGKTFMRYRYDVHNKELFPKELFAAAPALPPCGNNTKSSRTWVDVYTSRGIRLQGFCAFQSPDDLGKIWFALEATEVPPSYIYIELTDRQTNTKYKSNLADTTN